MQVLHINESDIFGGAAIAGYRLHQGLEKIGVVSKLIVEVPKSNSLNVNVIERMRLTEEIYSRLLNNSLGLNYINILSTFHLSSHNFYCKSNIINFHNLHGGYFNYLAISKLTKLKPAIWTLHDMWSFTGHCAYSYDCDRWQKSCGKCPYPDTYPAIKRDATHWEWELKNWVYSNSNLTIVTPSKWLTKQVQQSMLNRFPIHHIPYGIDTNAYQPLDQLKCQEILGIPKSKKVLMFGAQSIKDYRKGGDLLIKTLQDLPNSLKSQLFLLTLGESGESLSEQVQIPTMSLGYVNSDRLKSIAYSAADLFIFPTRADNLPLVLLESITCGTPMVSFDIGGVSDLVRPEITGYLASPENTKELGRGIINLLEDEQLRLKMAANCREIAVNEYGLELQATRYLQLYEKTVSDFNRNI